MNDSKNVTATGVPTMRPLWWEFPRKFFIKCMRNNKNDDGDDDKEEEEEEDVIAGS